LTLAEIAVAQEKLAADRAVLEAQLEAKQAASNAACDARNAEIDRRWKKMEAAEADLKAREMQQADQIARAEAVLLTHERRWRAPFSSERLRRHCRDPQLFRRRERKSARPLRQPSALDRKCPRG
jgi:hypothetical protein